MVRVYGEWKLASICPSVGTLTSFGMELII